MYKVTLSMPIYNVAPYVECALLSALNQTFESIEFLLVDDRGMDNSMEIVRRIIKDHPRGKDVRIIEHPHNIGTGATKNTAIDNAQGEYLFFMDSDDEITPDCIQVLYDKMMEEKVDFVAASYRLVDSEGSVKSLYTYKPLTIMGNLNIIKYQYDISHPSNKISITTWNKLYDVTFLKKNGIRCIENHVNEDILFSNQIYLKACSCSLLDNITLNYLIRCDSSCGLKNKQYNRRYLLQDLDIIQYYKKILINWKFGSLEAKQLFEKYYVKQLSYISLSIIKKGEKSRDKYDILDHIFDVNPLSNVSISLMNMEMIKFYIYLQFCFFVRNMCCYVKKSL